MSKIESMQEDINYFNGFRNAVKLLNHQFQYLQLAIDEVPEEKLPDTVKAWRKGAENDMEMIVTKMYQDMKSLYGMAMRIDGDDQYYILLDKNVQEN
jgi:hypothetical protein